MKRFVVIVLCLVIARCHDGQRDTGAGIKGRRTVEPRLTGLWTWQACTELLPEGNRILPEVRCGGEEQPQTAVCDIDSAPSALHALSQPVCTDAAVAALEQFARADPAWLSDLAAAYYVRARRDDRPRDLFRAYATVQEALRDTTRNAAALFNRALIEEALGLQASWDAVPDDATPWSTEAKARLARRNTSNAAERWEAVRSRLNEGRTETELSALIAPFPGLAQTRFEEMALSGNAPAPLAGALLRRTGDAFARDLLRRDPAALDLLAKYREARALSSSPRLDDVLEILDRIQPVAEQRRYAHLLARILSLRAYCLSYQGRFVEALDLYDKAAVQFARLGDREQLAGTWARRAGVAREAGDLDGAARDLLRALRGTPHLATGKEIQNVFGEAGRVAQRLGQPELALRYQEIIVAFYRRLLGDTRPDDLARIRRLQQELAIALYNRARIEVDLGMFARASSDLMNAAAYNAELRAAQSPDINRLIAMRLKETEGQTLLPIDRRRAAEAFSEALRLAATDQFRTYKASLYVQRAAAGGPDAAGDLQRAIAELDEEERLLLADRQRGSGEELWPGYFARFEDTYRRLIRHYVTAKDYSEAFRYTERARAREPRHLLAEVTPQSFRGVEAGTLAEIRRALPADTWLLEFSLHDDRTYVWTIARHAWRITELPIRRDEIERWSADLRNAAESSSVTAFAAGLDEPYRRLLRHVLPPRGANVRLVVIPDGALHGLPFAALRDRATGRHLAEDYILEYAPSATLYVSALTRNRDLRTSGSPSVLVIGNPELGPDLPYRTELGDLPHATAEAEAIGSMYAPLSTVFTGGAATVPAFLHHAQRSDIVHVAAHAVVNADTPAQSMLLLARSAEHSGALTAQELLTQLRLDRTRLVVLSTCSSAGGLPVGPEGVAPLVRPILTAGVPAVIGSLWKVPDATAKEFFVSFHRHYRTSSDAAKALQAAQLELLRSGNPARQSGLSWALFQVIGHDAPAHDKDKGEPP